MIRVPFFLLFSFNKRTQKQKGQKGTTQEPSLKGLYGGFGVQRSGRNGLRSRVLMTY